MKQAKYTVFVPRHDGIGNPLPHLAVAAHHYLVYGPVKVANSYLDRNKTVMRDRKPIPHDLLVSYGEDSPLMDSHIKQLAAYVGEVANHHHIDVAKESKNGIDHWSVSNLTHQPGVPAR